MAKIGVICPPLWGHLNPMLSLAKELQRRSHEVILYQIPELETKILDKGFTFFPIGQAEYSGSFLPEFVQQLGRLQGMEIIRYWYTQQEQMTRVVFRDLPTLIANNPVDLLLVDQVEPAGRAIAEYLNLPFITICNALALNREASIPPVFTPWSYQETLIGQLRNQIAYYFGDSLVSSYKKLLLNYRAQWGLPKLSNQEILFANSPVAQLSQQSEAFDFPRKNLPPWFHYCGPFRDQNQSNVSFPYECLTGQPLIYASLGTLQNTKFNIFACIASACQDLDVQLVISHGGGLSDEQVTQLPGTPLVVSYAPQLELLKHAHLTITHGGLNTVLDALTWGVPLVALPLGFEQSTIAARIKWTKTGEVIAGKQLNSTNLKIAIEKVLNLGIYRENALKMKQIISQKPGVVTAAEAIEGVLDQVRVNTYT
ncbi:glycosyltransferase [Gloeocapsa sp. PCC 73106]|uniref:glycosyltransferase n=1 Tax=Gloeocapsa sp. PCC 73106 TaxID=102232 RepID=UPI0002AC97D4|nr:nucleotide disphospho-sugar-binding domain-containing protein [Gloeocapsa sp. PCC 73106]ELR97084.1 glycosyltransferase, MGT family [Gloeocapsa sp. PCC 73106]